MFSRSVPPEAWPPAASPPPVYSPATSLPPDPRFGRRLGFGAALVAVMAVGPLTMYAITAVSPLIVDELDLSRTQLGLFATLAFSAAALLSRPAGRAVDRLGTRTAVLLVCVCAFAAVLAVAAAPSYAWLLVGVAASGAAQSLAMPATNRLVAEHLPPGRRGLVTGSKQGGVQVSQLLAGLTLPVLAMAFGWRVAVVALGCIVAATTVTLVRLHIPRSGRAAEPLRGRPSGSPPHVRWLLPYAFLTGAGLQAVNVHVPLFAHRELDLPVTVAGLSAAVIGGVGFVARIAWGRACQGTDRLRGPLAALACCGAAGSGLIVVSSLGGGTGWLWTGVAAYAATAVAANVLVMLLLVASNDRSGIGRATGIIGVGQFLGFAAGPVAFGAIVDGTGSYAVGWWATTAVHGAAALLVIAWVARDARRAGGSAPPGVRGRS